MRTFGLRSSPPLAAATKRERRTAVVSSASGEILRRGVPLGSDGTVQAAAARRPGVWHPGTLDGLQPWLDNQTDRSV